VGSSSLLVKIYYFVLIRKIGRIKNRLILTGSFIELGVIEIEYELNKINVFTKIDEEPQTEALNPGQTDLITFKNQTPHLLD
jgi:hypothetical protein